MIYSLHTAPSLFSKERDYHAELIEFPGWDDETFFDPRVDDSVRSMPRVLEFVGNLEPVSQADGLVTIPLGFLLLSKRAIRVLQAVALFRHRLIPAIIYSHEIDHLVRDKFTRMRTFYQVHDSSLRDDNFVVLQLCDILDCFDHERTIVNGVPFYQCGKKYLSDTNPNVQHYAFHTPEGGFPPVFYVPELLFYCYSEEAKQACDRAGLNGLRFYPLP